jgi:hypothetical protein
MADEMKFGRLPLERALKDLAVHLEVEVWAYLIGGLAMMFRGVSMTTKDIDIVLATHAGGQDLKRALEMLEFKEVAPMSKQDIELEAAFIMIGPGRVRYDVFVGRVCRRLVLTPSIIGRSVDAGLPGRLHLGVLCPEDLFLLKGVSGREDDLDDMAVLARMDLKWEAIDSEVRMQPESWRWLAQFHASLAELEASRGVVSPLGRRYEKEAEVLVGVAALLPRIERAPMTIEDARAILGETGIDFPTIVLKMMVDLGLAKEVGGHFRKAREDDDGKGRTSPKT